MNNESEKPEITEFRRITHAYAALQKLIPDTSPEKHCVLTKLLEAQMWLKFYLDIQEAEKNNPVKVGVSQKSKLEAADGPSC